VIDGLQGLRHDAVIRRDHQHHNIGDFGAARSHARERFVTRRVDKHDVPAVFLDVIGADVLGDAAGLVLGHVGRTNGIEQAGFAVIDVAHDGDHRWTLLAILFHLGLLNVLGGLFFVANLVGGGAEIARQLFRQFHIESLIDGGQNFLFHQPLDHQGPFDAELFGKLTDGDALGDGDFTVDGRRPRAGAVGCSIFSSSCRSRGCGREGRLSPGRPRAGSTGGGARPGSVHAAHGTWDVAAGVRPDAREAGRAALPAWLPSAGQGEWGRDKSAVREPARQDAFGNGRGRGDAAGAAGMAETAAEPPSLIARSGRGGTTGRAAG
jgi:hypothetical protein